MSGAAPVPIIFMHGTADELVPFAGGKIIPNGFRDRGSVLSDATTANFWQRRNNCGTAQVETLPDVAGDGTIVQIATYACPPGNGLINIIIKGGGHTWPGARQGIIADRISARRRIISTLTRRCGAFKAQKAAPYRANNSYVFPAKTFCIGLAALCVLLGLLSFLLRSVGLGSALLFYLMITASIYRGWKPG